MFLHGICTYTTEHLVCSEKSTVDSNSVKLRCTNITQLHLCCHGEWNWNSFSMWPASHEWKALPCHAWGWRQSPLRTPRTFLCSLHGYKVVQRDGTLRINIAGITFIHWSFEQFLRQCFLESRQRWPWKNFGCCFAMSGLWLARFGCVATCSVATCYKWSVPKFGNSSPGEFTRHWTKSSIETGE